MRQASAGPRLALRLRVLRARFGGPSSFPDVLTGHVSRMANTRQAVQIEGRAKELIEAPNFVTLASQREDDSTHLTVIWGGLEDGRIAVNSAEGRTWPENVRRNPAVSLVVVNSENPYEYVSIRGRVAEDTHEGADEHIDALSKKFLNKDEYPFRQPGEQRIKFLIEPDWISVQGG
jgi:PPOX class probable F420-dependent enzyme